jgi:hypothetical protein
MTTIPMKLPSRAFALLGFSALVFLFAFAILDDAGAKAKGHSAPTKTFKGGSGQDKGAKLTLQTNRDNGKGKAQIIRVKLYRGNATCELHGQAVPFELGYVFARHPVEFMRLPGGGTGFEVEEDNGGPETGEAVAIDGRVLKGGRIFVHFEREFHEPEFFVDKGQVQTPEEEVACSYRANFKLHLVR